MPLPAGGNIPWPPTHLKAAYTAMAECAAWWEGSPEKLSATYGGTLDGQPTTEGSFDRPARNRGGLLGTLRRWFWGQPTPAGQQNGKVHVPIAAEIAAASADLLFSRAITVTWGDEEERRAKRDEQVAAEQEKADVEAAKAAEQLPPDPITGLPPEPEPVEVETPDVPADPAQERFDALREASGLDSTLLEAAETCAAMAGVYLRLVWDEEIQDGPWIDVVHPDSAVPEWRYGRLWAVTFWRDLTSDDDRRNGKVVRHLERHERGRILHGLYQGDRDTLGRAIPLSEAPDLEGVAESLVDGNEIPAVPGRLTACYVPNMRPNPAWRRSPQLAPLGRSDFSAGVLGLMDRLDETMSSWMRDLRLGVGRIMVPEQYLENHGRGKGASFDLGREVFTTLAMLPHPGGPPQITPNQFQIRVDEHERTCKWLIDQIVRAAGYSAQTFGSDQGGTAPATATEINAREKRSVLTREKKLRYWDAELTELFWTWLLLDHALDQDSKQAQPKQDIPKRDMATPVLPDSPPEVEFPPLADADMLTLAQTAQAVFAASAASKYTLVKMIHPDWDEDQVAEELARIDEDAQASAPPDPMAMGAEQPFGGPPAPFGGEVDDSDGEPNPFE